MLKWWPDSNCVCYEFKYHTRKHKYFDIKSRVDKIQVVLDIII